MSCFNARCIVWALWIFIMFVSGVYLGVSMVTFHNVRAGMKYWYTYQNFKAFKNGMLASCILGFILVLYWLVFSFCVLIGRFFSSLAYGYGVMQGTCSHTGFFMLLAGLVLQAHEPFAQMLRDCGRCAWDDKAYHMYLVTYAFSYIICGLYLLMSVVLTFTSGAFIEPRQERSAPYHLPKPGSPSATSRSSQQELTCPGGVTGINNAQQWSTASSMAGGMYNGTNV